MKEKSNEISTKRVAITKANAQMVAIVAAASFVTVFCLIASKTVFTQNRYLARVSDAKQKAHHQLEENLSVYDDLATSYKAFNATGTNVIGGNSGGTGDNDGSNSKIILDALPSRYDYPALTSSLEKIASDRNLKISGITGTDDQVSQQANNSSPNPEAIEMPFSFTVENANYSSANDLLKAMQQSIRPLVIDSIDINVGSGSQDISITVNGHTYFQPARSVEPTKKVVK